VVLDAFGEAEGSVSVGVGGATAEFIIDAQDGVEVARALGFAELAPYNDTCHNQQRGLQPSYQRLKECELAGIKRGHGVSQLLDHSITRAAPGGSSHIKNPHDARMGVVRVAYSIVGASSMPARRYCRRFKIAWMRLPSSRASRKAAGLQPIQMKRCAWRQS